MKEILKTLVMSASEKKFSGYWGGYHNLFRGRNKNYDTVLEFMSEFWEEFQEFPDVKGFELELCSRGENDAWVYLLGVLSDAGVSVWVEDKEFLSRLLVKERAIVKEDIKRVLGDGDNGLSVGGEDLESLLENVDDVVRSLGEVKRRVVRGEESEESLVFGDSGHEDFVRIYERIRAEKEKGNCPYQDLGFSGFEGVKTKLGDLVVYGGYTSHGKSVMLRYHAYRMLVEYGLNVFFLSLEMPFSVVRALFGYLHANNKKIFPGTPKLKYAKFKNGELSEEEWDFLFNVAGRDLVDNLKYGSLYIEQPKRGGYSLLDFGEKVTHLERNVMPVHVAALDYLTLLSPSVGKRRVERDDYNQMIKEFKSLGLTHKDRFGKTSPMLCLTAAQISRGGLEAALKEDGKYKLSALSDYNELEKSSDIVFTVMMTTEMKALGKLRLQNLKNRDDEVVADPVDLYCELEGGYGVYEMEERSVGEIVQAIADLDI